MRTMVVVFLLMAAIGAGARADEDGRRRSVALGAALCAASGRGVELLAAIRKRASTLVKNPLAPNLGQEIAVAQRAYDRNDTFIDKVKAAMVEARTGTRSCSDKLTKKLVYCIQFEALGNSDGSCDEPDFAIYRKIDGVPVLDYFEGRVAAVIVCSTCGQQPPYCASCRADAMGWHFGPAHSRGSRWAEKVVRTVRDPLPPWPDTPKSRAIAAKWVSDLCRDEAVRAELAPLCWAAAERRYEELRADPKKVRDLRSDRRWGR